MFKKFMDGIVGKAKDQNKRRQNQIAFAGMVANSVNGTSQNTFQQPQKQTNILSFWLQLAVGVFFIALGGIFFIF
jgi:hypothetical protein